MIPSALWIGTNAVERSLLIGSCLVVLITELLNSAVESAIDRIGDDHHALSARAKDMGSAAVFVSLCLAGVIWTLIGYERFFAW
jgi:diacylglycerol kinase (ATP)